TPAYLTNKSYFILVSNSLIFAAIVFASSYLKYWPRMQLIAAGMGFMGLAWPILRMLNHLTMASSIPYADQYLANWDALIGFDWVAYGQLIEQFPGLAHTMDRFYSGLTAYSAIAFIAVVLFGRRRDGLSFIEIFLPTALLCTLVGAFFPAVAAATFYQVDADAFKLINPYSGAYHLEQMNMLRSGQPVALNVDKLVGLVTFPSFHTAMGVIVIWVCRSNAALFGISFTINAIMIASTPFFGNHYLIDVIAGSIVAVVAIAIQSLKSQNANSDFPPQVTFDEKRKLASDIVT
ncbi:MAG: phosphatase PAP2 family protein, partial [Pseudomonadota bacterium]